MKLIGIAVVALIAGSLLLPAPAPQEKKEVSLTNVSYDPTRELYKEITEKFSRAYGDDSTAHRTFHRWDEEGIFARIRDLVIREHPEMKDLPWAWEPSPGRFRRAQ